MIQPRSLPGFSLGLVGPHGAGSVQRRAGAALVAVALSLAAPAARANQRPDIDALKKQGPAALLSALDRYHNGYPTQKWRFRMTVKAQTGEPRSMVFTTWQKNQKLRLIRFEEPGDVKGLSILVRGSKVMYVYSPQTDNVRRVASHAKRQTFMGSDMTFDDMAQIDFGTDYDATVEKDDGGFLWMKLTRKAGSELPYDALRLRVNRKDAMIDVIEYFTAGKHLKTQQRTEHKVLDKTPTYTKVLMTTLATKHTTLVEMLDQKIGMDIPDATFKKRSLVRGE